MTQLQSEPIAHLAISAKDLKMLREALCVAQTKLDQNPTYDKIDLLYKLTDEIDRHRPLGSDGKHGNLHTPTCGCEDK